MNTAHCLSQAIVGFVGYLAITRIDVKGERVTHASQATVVPVLDLEFD
jgi:hypothetical protein